MTMCKKSIKIITADQWVATIYYYRTPSLQPTTIHHVFTNSTQLI